MKRTLCLLALAALTLTAVPAIAQVAGDNINVLPVYNPLDPDAYILGDNYLQRQLEPTIGVSTRNPDHLLAFFNDYRAVDVPDDIGIGETENVGLAVNVARLILTPLLRPMMPHLDPMPQIAAAAEAWVGGSRSYDGGLTWTGFFMPGAPFDDSPASLAAPIKDLEAATDPVIACGPCGQCWVVFVAFTRGGQSMMTVARFEDTNIGGDSWQYNGMTVVEIGNNADNGHFVDKPHINLDVFRPAGADECASRVYVSYSTFTGQNDDGKIQSKINFLASEDGGFTWEKAKINQPYSQNQGSVIAVDPRPGEPGTTGGGTVYLIWRHFFDPDTMVMTKTLDYGKKWSKPVELIGGTPMAAFDQPTLATSAVPDPPTQINFRSNGFPTATVTDDGTLFAAWQERVNIEVPEGDPAFGRPDPLGSPRIVLTHSTDGGDTWSARQAVDFGDRTEGFDPVLQNGLTAPARASGPQVMPDLSFGGGELMLAYYESLGLIGKEDGTGKEIIQPLDLTPSTTFMSGYDRVFNLRAALLDPIDGSLISTSQVSRYPILLGADLTDGQDLEEVAPINPPCQPGSTLDPNNPDPPCVRQVARNNAPQSGAGTSPFIGDYIDLVPTVPFVYENPGGWRWATQPGDVPYQGFRTVFADNRHLVPPTDPDNLQEWARYPNYGPPGIGGPCLNAGSRNTDVLTSLVDSSLVLSAPVNYQQLNERRGFPVSVRNATGFPTYYRLSLDDPLDVATFSVDPGVNVDSGVVLIFAYSSVSKLVYIDAGETSPITVSVVETNEFGVEIPGGQSGSIILNGDPSIDPGSVPGPPENAEPVVEEAFVLNPVPESAFVLNDGEGNAFVLNPFVDNAFVLNSGAESAFVLNAFVLNAFVLNAFVLNAFVLNIPIYDVIDTTWQIKPSETTTTASSYAAEVNIDNASKLTDDYAFQLVVSKNSSYGGFQGDATSCQAYALSQQQVLSNVIQAPGGAESAFVLNPSPENAFVLNAFPENAFVLNSTFTMAPPETAPTAKALTTCETEDCFAKAPLPTDGVTVTLRAYRLTPYTTLPPWRTAAQSAQTKALEEEPEYIYNPFRDTPSLTSYSQDCVVGDCITTVGPDLVPSNVDAGTLNIVAAGETIDFPELGWQLLNQGNVVADAENRDLSHGIFISTQPTVALDADGVPTCGAIRLASVPTTFPDPLDSTLGPGESLPLDTASITIPANTTPGIHYLVVHVDELKEVSETFENNNDFAVQIEVVAQNHAPTFTNLGAVSVLEDSAAYSAVWASDIDDGEPDIEQGLTFVVTGNTNPALFAVDAGPAVDAVTGILTFTPAADAFGTATITVVLQDDGGTVYGGSDTSDPAVFDIEITAVNDVPVVDPIVLEVAEDGSVTGILTVTDPDNDTFTYAVGTPPTNGTASFADPNIGTVVYSPDDDFNGTDSFTVTASDGEFTSDPAVVSVTISAVNDAPLAEDGAAMTDEDTSVATTLIATDVDGDPLTYAVVSGPANGTLSGTAPDLTYTPDANFNGTDSFTFKANDGSVDSNVATFTVNVTSINDAPVADDAAVSTDEDVPLGITLTGSDIDDDPLTFAVVTGPTSGALSGSPPNVTYTPNENYNGSDSFTFKANDGALDSPEATVSITVNPVNDAPVASDGAFPTDEDTSVAGALAASDVDGDPLTFAIVRNGALGTAVLGMGGAFTYTPNANASGLDSFTFTANDGTADSNVATVTVTITEVNDAPVAMPDVVTVDQNSGTTAIDDVTLNDTDVDDAAVSVVAVGPASNGTAAFIDGVVSYTPNVNYFGPDEFTYLITDGRGGEATGTVSVTVLDPVPDYGFLGLLDPWRPNYRMNLGKAFPIKWYYTDPITGDPVPSEDALPEIRIKGPFVCCPHPVCDEIPDTVEVINYPGSSNYQYDPLTYLQQFNWDTVGLLSGCYDIRIFSEQTSQFNPADGTGFRVQLR